MKSMAVSVVCIFAILGIIYAINYLFYRFSPFHTLPSIKTLPVRSILGVFIALLGYFGAFPYFIIFNRGISLFNSGNMYIYLPIILTVLLVAVIVGIFRYEKSVWLRHNLKYSRLMLPSWDKGFKNLCVSISKIDDIAYGRGVSFSWFDGSILVFNSYLCHFRILLTCYVCSTKIGENLIYPSVLKTLFLRHLGFSQGIVLWN